MKKNICLISLIVLISFLLSAGSIQAKESPNQKTKPPIKIGILGTLTGPTAADGIAHERGVKLFLDKIGWQVAGRKIEIYSEDTEAKPEVGLVKAKKLVSEKGVPMLMGVVMTNVAYALAPYVNEQKVPLLISIYVNADDLTKREASAHVFRCSYSTSQIVYSSAEYAYNVLGKRKAALLSLDYAAGVECSGAFARLFKKLGGTVVQENYASLDTVDWSPYIVKVDKSADILYGFIHSSFGMKFLRQWKEYGMQGKIPTIIDSGSEEATLEPTGDAALGNYMSRYWTPAIDTPANKKFMEAYYAKYGERATTGAAGGWLGMNMIVTALKSIKGNIEDQQSYLKALANVEIKDDVRGGDIKFDKYHQIIENIYITQVQKKAYKQYTTDNAIVHTYKSRDQFAPWTAQEYMAMPKLKELRGTWVSK